MDDKLEQKLAKLKQLAESKGFTDQYQYELEKKENIICNKELAPATYNKHDMAVEHWSLWRLSRNEAPDKNFTKDQPDPSVQELKIFIEYYVVTRETSIAQITACTVFSSLVSEWERRTSRQLCPTITKDVIYYIKNELTRKYSLETKPRERFLVTSKDIDYMLRRLFVNDNHDYPHERARIQTAASLSLFAGSGARAGAVVEASAYRDTNEAMCYRHITFNIKWSESGSLRRWVTIDPEFLKGWRYRKDGKKPLNWFNEHPVLGMSFIFWIAVLGIADGAFKGITTVNELLDKTPPKGRESWTLQWNPGVEDLPVFRMVGPEGSSQTKALTFSSLRNNCLSLSQREGFRDPLRIHGIRAGVANSIDPKASRAARTQALDHLNDGTFDRSYQSKIKRIDIQACFYGIDTDYECRDMQESMSHYRDTNVPQDLDSRANEELARDSDLLELDWKITELTKKINGRPQDHPGLVSERGRLYTKKAKQRRAKRKEFITEWWNTSYDEYIAGNDFAEKDTTCLYNIYRKYMPERDYLGDNLFSEVSLDSETGRQCSQYMVDLCTSKERVAYYPGEAPINGRCPICNKEMSSIPPQYRSKHILQCRRKSLNAAPYQQRYNNGKRAHRKSPRSFLEYCYLCAQWNSSEIEWATHCAWHLQNLQPRCGPLTFRYTLVAPGFCPFCLADSDKRPEERFQQWLNKATLMNHIDSEHLSRIQSAKDVRCPHPCCENRMYDGIHELKHHLRDVHSLEEPRSNCVSRKRCLEDAPNDYGGKKGKGMLPMKVEAMQYGEDRSPS